MTISFLILADDDSDTNPHDFDGVDLEYGLSSHLNIGQHSFSQMQVRIQTTHTHTHINIDIVTTKTK